MMRKSFTTLALTVTLVSACASFDIPSFQKNYSLYNREALKAESENKWDAAAKRYFLALQNSEWAEEGKGVRSEFHYKLGRALGATCQFQKSEQNLLQAYALNPRMPQALAELGRLKFAQKDSRAAIDYFDRSNAELSKTTVSQSDPIGYAEILDDYRDALVAENRSQDGAAIQRKASELRNSSPKRDALMRRPPYGAQCPTAKS